MSTYRDIRKLAIAQRRRFAIIKASMETGHAALAKAGHEDLQENTGGRISSKTLRRLGHPFGRGPMPDGGKLQRASQRAKTKAEIGRSKVPMLPINRQSGQLRRGIFFRRTNGGAQAFSLGSSARHNKYIFNPAGTKKMVGRGLMTLNNPKMGLLERRWRARDRELIEHVREKAKAN